MAKGDDALMRKKNKANRKKLQRDPASSVSSRIAAIIAAKKRRKSGKRSKCQGMCFSLPTPDDPFNDREKKDKIDLKEKETKTSVHPRLAEQKVLKEKKVSRNGIVGQGGRNVGSLKLQNEDVISLKEDLRRALASSDKISQASSVDSGETNIRINNIDQGRDHLGEVCENSEPPSKFHILCLNAIENALRNDCTHKFDEEKPLFVYSWGVEFWKCYSAGKDVLDTSKSSSTFEKIAWIVSSAADTITTKEKEGQSFNSPFLLFLVPTQEKANTVRSVCKPLKALGIHTVSIHQGAPLDHQIQGLKSCEPEFLVSTPERLMELVSVKAIDISGVSLLVVDGVECFSRIGHLNVIRSIRQLVSGNPRTVVFNDCVTPGSDSVVKNLLRGLVHRLSMDDNVTITSLALEKIQAVLVVWTIDHSSIKEDDTHTEACRDSDARKKQLLLQGK